MEKYYKVIKENFLWEVGAILKKDGNGYNPIDNVFCKYEPWDGNEEYDSSPIIETSPEYFERVYKVSLPTQVFYATKERAKELLAAQFKEE